MIEKNKAVKFDFFLSCINLVKKSSKLVIRLFGRPNCLDLDYPRMKWTVHIDGGPRRVNHAAVCVGDRIFSFGGYCTGDNYKDTMPIDIFVLDTRTYR